jgi:16S rRNA (guanine527-N7)-methyltransferase
MPETSGHPASAIEFLSVCRRNGLHLEEGQIGSLERYVSLLAEWNSRVNLVSRRDVENIWSAHLLHSVSLLFVMQLPRSARILDLGSGGGLPGIPLAIVRPDLQMVLVDSIAKKTLAMTAMVDSLGLKNIRVVCARAEELGGEHAGAYGVVLARAVAPLEELMKWSSALFDRGMEGGPLLVAYKGGDLETEISRVRLRGKGGDIRVVPLVFPGSAEAGLEEKKLVVVRIH